MSEFIYHIARVGDWEKAQEEGEYRCESLVEEGFIHCSTASQVLRVANALFSGQDGLVLLEIDQQSLQADIRWERITIEGESFPHVYGAINLGAVNRVLDFNPGKDGRWTRFPL